MADVIAEPVIDSGSREQARPERAGFARVDAIWRGDPEAATKAINASMTESRNPAG
jgi:hypothetical protein